MDRRALYIVATPIGNMDDMTPRALKTLREVDLIAAEDTRRAGLLMAQCGIGKKQFISYYDHVEQEKSVTLIDRIIREDLAVALISDAGTPCISDPGFKLVAEARRRGVPVHPIPGVSAVVTLVSAAGLATDRFTFIGFLPTKVSALRREITSWKDVRGPIVFYEAPRRLKNSLFLIAELYQNARVAIGRELTKLHEEIVTLPVEEAQIWLENHQFMKGEATVMVDLRLEHDLSDPLLPASDRIALKEQAKRSFKTGASLKDLLQRFADCGFSRGELYRVLLEAKGEEDD